MSIHAIDKHETDSRPSPKAPFIYLSTDVEKNLQNTNTQTRTDIQTHTLTPVYSYKLVVTKSHNIRLIFIYSIFLVMIRAYVTMQLTKNCQCLHVCVCVYVCMRESHSE